MDDMTIRDMETATGLTRSNIRFYEKEGLIQPGRQANGYRDYSAQDAQELRKVACLRTLELSLEEIRQLQAGSVSLTAALEHQQRKLSEQTNTLAAAQRLCESMLREKNLSYQTLRVEDYGEAWQYNRKMIQLDAVRWIDVLRSKRLWWVMEGIMLLTALIGLLVCPEQIPVQWEGGQAVSLVQKTLLLAYPAAGVLARLLGWPIISQTLACWLGHASEVLTAYLINFLCFTALTVEIFTVLYTQGLVSNVQTVLMHDGTLFVGVLLLGVYQFQVNKGT